MSATGSVAMETDQKGNDILAMVHVKKDKNNPGIITLPETHHVEPS